MTVINKWQTIIQEIKDAGRAATLIAVSKSQHAEAIIPLLEAGHRDFGENKIQEALGKWPILKSRYKDVRLHLIGSVQTNKVKDALTFFDAIHTVDRESLIDAIIKERNKGETHCQQFFIQVNTGEESQKGGVSPFQLEALLNYSREKKLPITGLMCVPPVEDLPAPHFALLRTLGEKWKLENLSMGMSDDYPTALRLGATHIRVGTALFGERPAL